METSTSPAAEVGIGEDGLVSQILTAEVHDFSRGRMSILGVVLAVR
jgi:hypothetical protein